MGYFADAAEIVPERTDFGRLPLDALSAPQTLRGITIWRAHCAGRRYPAYEDLKPRAIAEIMPYMSMIAVIDGGQDFENRFVGDAVVQAHHVPIRHRRFSDVAKDMPTLIYGLLPLFRDVVRSGEPLAYRGRTGQDMAQVVYSDFEGVLLPLGPDDATVSFVLYVGKCALKTAPLH